MLRMVLGQGKRLTVGTTPGVSSMTAARVAAIGQQQSRTYAEVLPFMNPASSTSKADDIAAKYKAKLEQKAASEGAESVDELKEKYKDKIKTQNAIHDQLDPYAKLNPAESADPSTSSSPNMTAKAAEEALNNAPKVPSSDIKDLDSFVDTSKLKLHDRKEIEMLWKMRFSTNPLAICGVVDGQVFSHIYKNARQNPMFVLPLPREAPADAAAPKADEKDGGVEMHLVQWQFVGPFTLHCIFTTLAEYKLHQEYARPHTTLIMHSDLLADKNIALINGTVEKDSAVGLNEAHLLTLFLQKIYSADPVTETGKRRLELLNSFTSGDANFSVEKLCSEVESLE